MRVLILLIAAVGLGSFAFHTIATRWAALLDIGFIAVFVLAFHQRFQVHALGRSNGAAILGVGVFVVLAGLFVFATKQLPTLSQNDSESYLAPFLLLLVCARRAAPLASASACSRSTTPSRKRSHAQSARPENPLA